MAATLPNFSLGESDRVEERNVKLLRLEAELKDTIEELEEAWDRATDHGYGNPAAISDKLSEARETLKSLRLFRSFSSNNL